MSRIMKVTCDWCGTDITNTEYQTMTFRRYAGVNHEKVYRLPTMWMCNKCYKKMALKMSFPPYEEDGNEIICSECGEKTTSTVMGKPRYEWCPMCGADMRGET